ncbi:DUF4253 domain-containing protein [Streptomyces sp. 142MFCol3.1]|uniref:DUF4253 domain-containing protein n=1 Tax=Streptomyces sp. 142MFCol3.1 TaxID=1172179 RepID=UPI000410928B|nr:DUF4253 domain-containing protein [Streptomyces sp. 142MFCol3.1]
MTFPLPDRLPAGHLIRTPDGTPVMWCSESPPADPHAAWIGHQRRQAATGLLPVLCYRDVRPTPFDPADVDAFDLEGELAKNWAEYRRRRFAVSDGPSEPFDCPEDVEPWEDDPGPPFEQWPGLAPATLPAGGVDPDEAARAAFAHLVDDDPYALTEARLGLVAAERSADIPALLDWYGGAPKTLLCALLRSWEDRFGARVLTLVGATLYVSVASPPHTREQAERVALEHLLTTADNIVDDPPTPFPRYAQSLVGAPLWRFWWD